VQNAPNWSGYAATTGPFSHVAGSFEVPRLGSRATCLAKLSIWVGADGMRSAAGASSLVQAGITESAVDPSTGICAPRNPYVYAWWEIIPDPPQKIGSLTVRPGDRVSVTLRRRHPGRWSIAVDDHTRRGAFSTVRDYTGPGSSAEWILEAPSDSFSCGAGVDPWVVVGLCPMPPFSSTAFFDMSVGGRATQLWPIAMVQEGHQVSTPSGPLGNAFGLMYTGLAS